MNAKVWAAAFAGLVVGMGIGWVAKPSGAATTETTAGPVEVADAASRPHRPAAAERDDPSLAAKIAERPSETESIRGLEDLDPEMRRQIEEAQEKQAQLMKRGLQSKFDLRIARLVESLGLDAGQEKLLRDYVENRLEGIDASTLGGMSGMPDEEKLAELAALLRGDGIVDELSPHLNDEQRDSLDAVTERERRNSVEARALKQLSRLQGTLDLDETQRDEVYGVLMEDADSWLDRQSDADFVMREMMSTMGVEMELGDMDMSAMMEMHHADDPAEVMQQMREEMARQREAKVERLSGILDEDQLDRYRQSLENQGGMMNMMIDAAETGEGE